MDNEQRKACVGRGPKIDIKSHSYPTIAPNPVRCDEQKASLETTDNLEELNQWLMNVSVAAWTDGAYSKHPDRLHVLQAKYPGEWPEPMRMRARTLYLHTHACEVSYVPASAITPTVFEATCSHPFLRAFLPSRVPNQTKVKFKMNFVGIRYNP